MLITSRWHLSWPQVGGWKIRGSLKGLAHRESQKEITSHLEGWLKHFDGEAEQFKWCGYSPVKLFRSGLSAAAEPSPSKTGGRKFTFKALASRLVDGVEVRPLKAPQGGR